MFRGRVRSIHFVGIGGVGMSGIAEVLLEHGFQVSGSDLRASDTTRRLQAKGAHVFTGHAADQIQGADVVVISSAVSKENPEVVAARSAGVPVIPRAEMLGELMRLKDGIAIAGSHGKTTTTSLLATVLREAELDPTVVIGGRLNALGSGAARGAGDLLVAEADESDGSFLHLTPTIAVITNIDPEHLEHFGSLDAVKDAFVQFANRVPFYGLVVACMDHPNVQDILPSIDKRTATYGFSAQADYRARKPTPEGLSVRFSVERRGEDLGEFVVPMPGMHNVLNALATIAVSDEVGVPASRIQEGLHGFEGVQRRFTVLGTARGVTVVDDYAHHPAEIEATLEAAQRSLAQLPMEPSTDGAHAENGEGVQRRVIVAFQPHRYSRTQSLFEEFSRAFNRADKLFISDIYPAGEAPIEGVTSRTLAEAIRAHGHRQVNYVGGRAALMEAVLSEAQPGDVVLTLGAGDITKTAPEIYSHLSGVTG